MTRISASWTECAGCENNLYADWVSGTCPEAGSEDCVQQKKLGRMKRTERHRHPEPMPEPVAYYSRSDSRYPEVIRMSFADGHTEIYDRRVNQPRPDAYVNQPERRRKRK